MMRRSGQATQASDQAARWRWLIADL